MICTVFYLVFSVLWLMPGSVTTASGQVKTTDTMVPEGGDYCTKNWQCPSREERERARNRINRIATQVILASTCSGPGWRCVAFINMTDTSYNCPTGLNLTYSKRTCGRSYTTRGGCSSTTFSVGGSPYSRVCGRIRGYQFGETTAFHALGIDSYYADGIILSHGDPGSRQHIWTFAAGLDEVSTLWRQFSCPCDMLQYDHVPSFVGNDYFCESGLNTAWDSSGFTFYPNDVLWDGQNCTSTSTCCQLNNPPWFTKNLPTATTDDIELRLCTNLTPTIIDDVPIELIELYVQ